MILKLLTYNMQAGIGSRRFRHVFTHGFRYIVPHSQAKTNLDAIAEMVGQFDLVALQEADSGSFRTRYVHQTEYLAQKADIPYWHSQVTKNIGEIARMSLGLLSRHPLESITEHRLPASKHGRGALEAIVRVQDRKIAVFATHLSLRKASRMRQIRFLAQKINHHESAILMGDLNCTPDSEEFAHLIAHTNLANHQRQRHPATFPSWRPLKGLDHILVTRDITIEAVDTLPFLCSDHLPLHAAARLSKTD
ncbi:MAG TPA: endonuclease/exonuclease/phosphatase family protein [Mariprofundaceae bacterium]|nr:endonuclease/exonuclease/phosphatase family protein [Mariprofundaceae bacterium]